jgi:signal transduction histidine kinase
VIWDEYPAGKNIGLSPLLNQALSSMEEERRAVISVLQEDIGQTMAALIVHLRLVERVCASDQCGDQIVEARAMASDILHSIESLTRRLYPPALESQGLGPALEVYAKGFTEKAHIYVELDLEVLSFRPTADIELAMFRITQEAFENILHYTYASVVRVIMREVDHNLCLLIEDDGGGYSAETLSNWQFLRMIQRAEAFGGTCRFMFAPGHGTRVEVRIPVKKREAS